MTRRTQGLRRNAANSGWQLSALFAAAALSLATAVPAGAVEKDYHGDAGLSYSCGATPALGMRALLTTSAYSCTTERSIDVASTTADTVVATWYRTTTYPASTKVWLKEAYFDTDAAIPGELTIQVGTDTDASHQDTSFIMRGEVTQRFDTGRVPGGVRVDLSTLKITAPSGSYLALRILKKAGSTFQGKVWVNPGNSRFGGSPRMVAHEGARYITPGASTIQTSISLAVDGESIVAAPGVYASTGISFIGKKVTLVSEQGPGTTIVDSGYGGTAFNFVYASETNAAVLDGFTITRATTAVSIGNGASPTIRNCIIRDSESNDTATKMGAGILIAQTGATENVVVDSCLFLNNRATLGGGAIAVNNASSRLTVRKSLFSQNTAGTKGGAIDLETNVVDVQVLDSTFSENVAPDGGAIHALGTGTIVVSGCSFTDNRAGNGGALKSGSMQVVNSVFTGNQGTFGGAIFTQTNTGIDHATFVGNSATAGGAIRVGGGILSIFNSILWNNAQTSSGTGAQISAGTGAFTGDIRNTILEGGRAGVSSTITLASTSIAIIDADPLFAFPDAPYPMPGSPAIDAGLGSAPAGMLLPSMDKDGISRALTACATGVPDIGAYEYHGDCGFPVLVTGATRATITGVQGGAPPDALEITVRNASATPLHWKASESVSWLDTRPPVEGDISSETGAVSIFSDTTGLLAGEYRGSFSLEASGGAGSPYPQDSPKMIDVLLQVTRKRRVSKSPGAGEYATIQAAVNDGAQGDEVVVADGTWQGTGNKNITLRNKNLTIRSENGRDATTIDCQNAGRGFYIRTGEARTSTIQGFTIKQCKSENAGTVLGGGLAAESFTSVNIVDCVFKGNVLGVPGDSPPSLGGGALISGNAFIANCVFDGNDAYKGGGLNLDTAGDVLVVDTVFKSNTGRGAGVAITGSSSGAATFRGCTFESNAPGAGRTPTQGGGALVENAGATIMFENCRIKGNSTAGASSGGGIYASSGTVSVVNSVFTGNSASLGGGISCDSSAAVEVTNCTLYANTGATQGGGILLSGSNHGVVNTISYGNTSPSNPDIGPADNTYTRNSLVGAGWAASGNANKLSNPLFVDAANGDFRLQEGSPAIDAGQTIDWLFSDYRGSYRAVDGGDGKDPQGAPDGTEAFDMGAFEYSRYWGGIEKDVTANAFRDLTINGAIAATGYEYSIEWTAKDPFPYKDVRVQQAGQYEARLLLVADNGRRVELGTWTMRLAQSYTVKYVFGPEHTGTWRLRMEMVSDPNQYVLSSPVAILYKELRRFDIGKEIVPPDGAAPGVKPDIDRAEAVYWSTDSNRLYAIAPYNVVITWYQDTNRTLPLLMVAKLVTPSDPQLHIADGPPVGLLPAGSRFDSVSLMWTNSGAAIASNSFAASGEGWGVLLFRDSKAAEAVDREVFLAVRTLAWNHVGTETVLDPFYGNGGDPNHDGLPPLDPVKYPLEKTADIGSELTDAEHQQTACGSGYLLNEIAPYDGAGADRAYDRSARTGGIFVVNEDDSSTTADDLVVLWYRRNDATGTCWPFKPVRYDPVLPAVGALCQNGTAAAGCNRIEIAKEWGSGPLDPGVFGSLETMRVYSQTDRKLSGFNPNEEHASFFTAGGGEYPGVFPLRTDLNRTAWGATPPFTSQPYVLLKYREPGSGDWSFKYFSVSVGDLTFAPEAGTEFNPPYPLNQFVFGPCRDNPATAGLREGSYTSAVPPNVLTDKDGRLFAVRGGVTVANYHFYRLQDGFWFDELDDGYPDKPTGTCVPWLAGKDGGNPYTGAPTAVTNNVVWPATTPTLYVGETLLDAKQQTGETVGLPNVKDQCIVKVLYDEAGVKLMDPTREHTAPLSTLAGGLRTDPPTGLGSGVRFLDLPPTLQGRLTYDSVNRVLKLKGEYRTDTGEPTLMLTTLTQRERTAIKNIKTPAFSDSDPFMVAVDKLIVDGNKLVNTTPANYPDGLRDVDVKAISAGSVTGAGYVTIAFNNDTSVSNRVCNAPTMLSVIKVGCPLYQGDIKVVESPNPFEEKLTLRHNADFGGNADGRYFEWKYLQGFSGLPLGPDTAAELWQPFDQANSNPGQTGSGRINQGGGSWAYLGLNDITPVGTGQQLLPDRWFSVRYVWSSGAGLCGNVSPWTKPQLAEGWVKRVMKKVNLFDQKVKDFHTTSVDTVAHMIGQAGGPYEGDVALNDDPAYLKKIGLIQLYETLLRRVMALGMGDPDLQSAVLFATTRLNALYMLLGNEAFADAEDPTVGYSTRDGQFGALATSLFAFQNQTDSLLEEELALLRGRAVPPAQQVRPFYNRLPWNFTIGEGEVAYRQTYGIQDVADANGEMVPDGEINEFDAKALFPQGHGDAWGHYLSALKKWYRLITADTFAWQPTVEAILVAQAPVEVDYRDERAFAAAAAARARAGAGIVGLTYRQLYDENPLNQWQGYSDTDASRAWGLDEWASRAGQGAYFDWAIGNAMLPDVDRNPAHDGIQQIDRTTVVELFEIPAQFDAIQAVADQADAGLNPLGVAKDTVPFDIDPALVAKGETHFEQIYARAVQTLNNAVTVFDYANQGTQLLRRQQDSLDNFKRTVDDREADFNNRLIEVFGYPYAADCGPTATYATGYCESGPDIYHFMYVDPSDLMGQTRVKENSFDVTFRDLEVDSQGALKKRERKVTFAIDPDPRLGIIRPQAWSSSRRRAQGSLQLTRSDLLQLNARFDSAILGYNDLIAQIEDEAKRLQNQYGMNASEIKILNKGKNKQISLNDAIATARTLQWGFRTAANNVELISKAISEGIPKVLGVGLAVITDPFSFLRTINLTAGQVASHALNLMADIAGQAEQSNSQAKEMASLENNIELTAMRGDFAVKQELLQLGALVRREAAQRQELYTLAEGLKQSAQRYLNALANGERILEERLRFRKQTASQVQDYRYTDMTFRVFRNDALQKYRAQFDLASRYSYLAAKAYDFETTLLDSRSMAGGAFLAGLVKEQNLGKVVNGEPLAGIGLADNLRRLSLNFQVLKPQLGFNNPQMETNRFSLRQELFRVLFDDGSRDTWRDTLEKYRVPDLWAVSEFRRLCRPFAAEGIAEPGLVIPFRTTVTSRLNFFGWPLGGGDSSYSAANFATKVRSVGVWFTNYNATGLALTPRVYLVPAGEDVLRSPTGGAGDTRAWHVMDQKLPVPSPVVADELNSSRGWIPAVDTLHDEMGEVRQHADFKAFHDGGYLDKSEMVYDTRLIGRSVWNTKWVLVIPGSTLLYDPDEGLDTFIYGPEVIGGAGERTGRGISDIKLFFETYAYQGY
jgi:predicted outer membrane repeat protein